MELVRPALEHVPSYLAARDRGFSFDMNTDPEAVARYTEQIRSDPAAFIATVEDLDPAGRMVTLPDGSQVPRLPQYTRWMWDGEFAGVITFRWQRGTTDLPPTCHGHIGYAVVEWKRRLGYATLALHEMLELPRREGLAFVEVTTSPDNLGSQAVILANGGVWIDDYVMPASQGAHTLKRYRITLD